MKLRRPQKPIELGSLPLDAQDAYLLSRFDDAELTLMELADLLQSRPDEIDVRVEKLLALGLLEHESVGLPNEELEGTPPDLVLDFADDEQVEDLALDAWPCPDDEADPPVIVAPSVEPDPTPFTADPPSTLISLLKRGPLQVDIYSVPDAPDPRAPRHSDTFAKIEVEGPKVQTFAEILAAKKRR